MLTHRSTRQRELGQATTEYAAVVFLVVVLIGGFVTASAQGAFGEAFKGAVCRAVNLLPGASGGDCGAGEKGDTGGKGDDSGQGDGETSQDGSDDDSWPCRVFGLFCSDDDGGADSDDPDIPDGLDPDSDVVRTLLSTERGRETLQWLADHDIPIVVDPGATGAYWDGSQIVLGEGFDDAAVLVHETNHARYDDEDRGADIDNTTRDEYIEQSIHEEADGVGQQVMAAKEFRDAGHEVPPQPGEDEFWDAYDAAHQSALDAGKSEAEATRAAEDAGVEAVEQLFYDGTFVASTTGESYPDLYGGYWDDAH